MAGIGYSSDFVICFSTAYRILDRPERPIESRPFLVNEQMLIGQLGLAVIETVIGRDGNTRYALPPEQVAELWQRS